MSEIASDPAVLNGNPHVAGTRLSVYEVVWEAYELGVRRAVEELNISKAELEVALTYCSSRRCDIVGEHCGGCSLRHVQDGIRTAEEFVDRFAEVRFERSDRVLYGSGQGVMILSGSERDLEQNWLGEDGWKLASDLLRENPADDRTSEPR